MPNVAALHELETMAAYKDDGFAQAVMLCKGYWGGGSGALASDSLAVTRNLLSDNTVTALETAASNLYVVHMASPSGASNDSFVQLFNAATGSVTLGTTVPDFVLRCPAGKDITAVFFPGNDARDIWSTAISYAVTTTGTGSTAPNSADRPALAFLSE